MFRKSLHVSIVICLLAAVIMPAGVAAAQQPLPPSTPQTGQVPPVDPVKNGGPVPELVQKAAQLQQSLSPSQQTAIRAVLDQYRPELADIAAVGTPDGVAVTAPTGPQAGAKQPTANLPETKQSEAKRIDSNQAARMTAVLSKIDAGMAGILNADQLNLYRAVIKPDSASIPMTAAPGLTASPNLLSKSDSAPSAPAGYTSYCFYAAYYGAYATYYAYYAYIYSYYNYYYYGTTYGYYAYYYNYYAYNYLKLGLDYSAPLYFLWYYTGIYQSGYPYNSYYYNYYGQYYGYTGYYYAYYDYSNTGNTYAYYAYAYSYYSYYYAYNAYYNAYYCYYYS